MMCRPGGRPRRRSSIYQFGSLPDYQGRIARRKLCAIGPGLSGARFLRPTRSSGMPVLGDRAVLSRPRDAQVGQTGDLVRKAVASRQHADDVGPLCGEGGLLPASCG